MQREILFRGQRKSDKYWLYGDLIKKGSRRFIGYEIEKSVEDYGVENSAGAPGWKTEYVYIEAEVIPETVGQYTGLYDMKGVKIYEGDILSGYRKGSNSDIGHIGVIQWIYGQAGWVIKCHKFILEILSLAQSGWTGEPYNVHQLDSFKIIGTIHTHPELLTTVK